MMSAQRRDEEAARLESKVAFFLHKVVLITGASSGIGRSLAFWYLNNGAKVVMVGRDQGTLDDMAK